MKRICTVFFIVMILSSVVINAYMGNVLYSEEPINIDGQRTEDSNVRILTGICRTLDGSGLSLERATINSWNWFLNLDEEKQDLLLSVADFDDYIVVFSLIADGVNPYPEVQPFEIRIESDYPVGHWRSTLLGRDYRLYYLENNELQEIAISEYDEIGVEATVDRISTYVLYYNPAIYTVTFYDDALEYDDEFEIVNEEYYKVEHLRKYDTFDFPEIPEREGYVFTGWKHEHGQGAYYVYEYVKPHEYFTVDKIERGVRAFDVSAVYASWCPEEEYTPLEVTVESETSIRKGKEDGAEIFLKLSEGKFAEIIDSDIENDWKIVSNDEVSIGGVERVDDTTAKLTLSGNSSDKYTNGEIQVEFNSELYISHGDYANMEAHEIADIQLDENGIKKAMFISDNSIALEKQKKSGGDGIEKHTVSFETNGGETIQSVRIANGHTLEEPERVLKEGHVFVGWYTDEELTNLYNFEESVTDDFTLYAAWEKSVPQTIILTVGEKEAIVFGKEVTNDVAPLLKNDRVMLPVRFVAENLGADVEWSADNPKEVKILKGETELVIFIDESYAEVNGNKVPLDSPAFLENDRTYLPIRFIAENLGCNVEWDDKTKQVIITK